MLGPSHCLLGNAWEGMVVVRKPFWGLPSPSLPPAFSCHVPLAPLAAGGLAAEYQHYYPFRFVELGREILQLPTTLRQVLRMSA